tara:strand:+ start:728 stop:1033 length:306 start_codon:yes stop_codon:yes gene_type:complete
MKPRNRRAVCKDGYSISIQAHKGAYCQPKQDDAECYSLVELGYPNQSDSLIDHLAETPDEPRDSVYGYVPVNTVYLLLTKHQGVVSGDVPKGVPYFSGSHG